MEFIYKKKTLKKVNILKRQNCANEYMKTDFSKVIFTDKSRGTFNSNDV